MGFMDKAKKLAEQAQDKLDEVQKQFNEGQQGTSQAPPVEYDQHGRPCAPSPRRRRPKGPRRRTATRSRRLRRAEEPERKDEYAPPKLTGGDPLAG